MTFDESKMINMEIELTPEQYDKVVDMETHGISYGDAIDLLFKVKLEILAQIDSIDNNLAVYERVKSPDMAIDEKRQIIEAEYGDVEEAYENQVKKTREKVKWARDNFDF